MILAHAVAERSLRIVAANSENSAFWLIFERCSKNVALALEFSPSRDQTKSRFAGDLSRLFVKVVLRSFGVALIARFRASTKSIALTLVFRSIAPNENRTLLAVLRDSIAKRGFEVLKCLILFCGT